ncbi:PAS domain S-box protein [Fictibacillus iocasae]|uniref:histidine kinase n=1 Tax=Fictibacillus iocasae TaxID=2715437 RepID=A0ABW2NUK8_9BACL
MQNTDLTKKQDFMDLLYEAVASGVIVINRDNLITHANDAVCRMFGYKKEEVIGKCHSHFCYNMIDSEGKAVAFEQMPSQRTLSTGECIEGLELGMERMGSGEHVFWLLISTKPIYCPGGVVKQVVITLVDITARKKTEEALKISEHRFRTLVDSMDDTVFTLDMDLRHTGVYGKWMQKNGVDPGYFIGRSLREVYGTELAQGHEEACYKALTGQSQIYEWSKEDRFGKKYYQAMLSPLKNSKEHLTGIVGVSRDITEQKKMAEGLLESEERFRQFSDNAKDVFWMNHYPDHTPIYMNPAFNKIWGIEAQSDFLSVFSHIHSEDEASVNEWLLQMAEGESMAEYRIVRHDESIRWIRCRAFPIYDEDGRVYRVAGIAEDITELKEKEELLRKSDKLTVVGELAAGIAHEIRNPLTSIKGFIQLLRSDMDPFHSDIILTELSRIESIINEFLILAKPHQNTLFHYKNVNEFIKQTILLLDSEANLNNVQFESHLNEVPDILCEGNQIKQVLINVLKNAIESMMCGGKIKVETGETRKGFVYIKVIDEGIGISEERLARLGEPFYSNKEKGIGLGLMVSLKIIENHHGSITFSSKKGMGTEVTILLPTKLFP